MKKAISIWTARLLATLTVLALASGSVMAAAPMTHGPMVRLRHGASTNWAGYAAYGSKGNFNSVSSSWVQPSLTCGSTSTYSSYWVGLDGYNNSTVEQLGTEADCSGGTARNYVWYEMYPKRSNLVNMTVSTNDHMSASVVYSGGKFTLSITNQTTGKTFSTVQRQNNAGRSSAEAIVEAPYSGGTLPLANFGTVNFANTLVNSSPIGNFTYDAIIMASPSIMKASPSDLTNGTDFSVTWHSS